jgi:hypothetical protein
LDPFSYLSVLVSIILGLGITQLLTGVGRLLNARTRVRWYWPPVAWAVLLLVIHIEAWWGMFGLRSQRSWTFASFLVVLALPIVLYLASALVLPESPAGGSVELRENYYAHAGWLFTFCALILVTSFVRPYAFGGRRPLDLDTAAHTLFFAGFVVAAITRREWYHKALAVFTALLLGAYVTFLFYRLR